jgi:ribonucleoside-diphosphate reductase alpha chain
MERDPRSMALLYKLKWPETDHAIYITMNNIVKDGKPPFEISSIQKTWSILPGP